MMKDMFLRLFRKIAGNEFGTALLILCLIFRALRSASLGNIAKRVYQAVPSEWRYADGSDKEPEWIEAISAGERFLRAVSRITT